jgi:predicted porin
MQKKLIALAIAGLSGAAFAQSNVTIYGTMDGTYDNVTASGATNVNAAGVAATASTPSRSRATMNSSYIGFKGVESIGNGLAVAFQIETGVGENPTGSFNNVAGQSYGWANRDTYVGLAGGFGTIALGNVTGPTRALGAAMDVNAGATGIGANTALLGKLGGGSGAGYFDQRIANAIAYISPTVSGFSGVIGYQGNENRGSDASQGAPGGCISTTTGLAVAVVAGACPAGSVPALAATQANTHAWTMGVTYANGPIYTSLAYTTVKDDNASGKGSGFAPATGIGMPLASTLNALFGAGLAAGTTPLEKIDNTRAGFKYDFGMATVGILWDRTKATVAAAGGLDAKQTVWYIPVTFKLGNGKLIAQYGKANKVTGGVIDTYQALGLCAGQAGAVGLSDRQNCDYSSKHFEIGYEYALSKRTTVKALWSQITNSKDATNDFLYGVSAPNTTGTGNGVAAGSDPRGFSVGLRHSF